MYDSFYKKLRKGQNDRSGKQVSPCLELRRALEWEAVAVAIKRPQGGIPVIEMLCTPSAAPVSVSGL